MFAVVKQAKLTVQEFASVANVSRVTASQWLNGHKKPHVLHANKIDKLVKAIKLAVDNKELPLPNTVTRADRLPRLKKIIVANIKVLKESEDS